MLNLISHLCCFVLNLKLVCLGLSIHHKLSVSLPPLYISLCLSLSLSLSLSVCLSVALSRSISLSVSLPPPRTDLLGGQPDYCFTLMCQQFMP